MTRGAIDLKIVSDRLDMVRNADGLEASAARLAATVGRAADE